MLIHLLDRYLLRIVTVRTRFSQTKTRPILMPKTLPNKTMDRALSMLTRFLRQMLMPMHPRTRMRSTMTRNRMQNLARISQVVMGMPKATRTLLKTRVRMRPSMNKTLIPAMMRLIRTMIRLRSLKMMHSRKKMLRIRTKNLHLTLKRLQR